MKRLIINGNSQALQTMLRELRDHSLYTGQHESGGKFEIELVADNSEFAPDEPTYLEEDDTDG